MVEAVAWTLVGEALQISEAVALISCSSVEKPPLV